MTSINKRDFINKKITSLIKWIEEDKILPKTHNFVIELKSFLYNPEAMIKFMIALSAYADEKGNIADNYLKIFFSAYKIDFDKLEKEVVDKLKRYIACFVKLSQN